MGREGAELENSGCCSVRATAATATYGSGSGSSRSVANSEEYQQLEALARVAKRLRDVHVATSRACEPIMIKIIMRCSKCDSRPLARRIAP